MPTEERVMRFQSDGDYVIDCDGYGSFRIVEAECGDNASRAGSVAEALNAAFSDEGSGIGELREAARNVVSSAERFDPSGPEYVVHAPYLDALKEALATTLPNASDQKGERHG